MKSFLRDMESRAGDFLLNIETHGSVYFDRSGARRDYSDYETTSHLMVMAALRMTKISGDDVAYVLGSGKGRAIAHFARRKLRKVVGIELAEDLCRISRNNIDTLKGGKTPVEIRNQNVLGADLSDATIIYMFNPFGPETMRTFLKKTGPFKAGTKIIYLNPVCSSVLEEFSGINLIRTVKYPFGPVINYYEFR